MTSWSGNLLCLPHLVNPTATPSCPQVIGMSLVCVSISTLSIILTTVFRYKLQDFIYLNETGVIELAKQSWLDSKKFQKLLYQKANALVLEGGKLAKNTLVVPLLIGEPGQKSLRVKTINETELNYLRGSTRFEVVKDPKLNSILVLSP